LKIKNIWVTTRKGKESFIREEGDPEEILNKIRSKR
jgi:hypothetical protein